MTRSAINKFKDFESSKMVWSKKHEQYFCMLICLSKNRETEITDMKLVGMSSKNICLAVINEMDEHELSMHKSGKPMFNIAMELSLPHIAHEIRYRLAWLRRRAMIFALY